MNVIMAIVALVGVIGIILLAAALWTYADLRKGKGTNLAPVPDTKRDNHS